jgi:hypothetical protein
LSCHQSVTSQKDKKEKKNEAKETENESEQILCPAAGLFPCLASQACPANAQSPP